MARLTDHLDMNIAVDWDVKYQTKQTNFHTDISQTFDIEFSICCMEKGKLKCHIIDMIIT